jgi:kynurenine formamidase
MSRIVELGEGILHYGRGQVSGVVNAPGTVLQSLGARHHAVSLGFHDSQMKGRALLIQTGWDARRNTDAYWEPGPFLADEFAFRLVRAGAKAVALDFPKADIPAYVRLLDKDICIIEQLANFAAVPRTGSRFHAVPLEAGKGATARVRAYVELE